MREHGINGNGRTNSEVFSQLGESEAEEPELLKLTPPKPGNIGFVVFPYAAEYAAILPRHWLMLSRLR